MKKEIDKRIDEAANKYSDSCDNESGGFLSHQLVAIREKAFQEGAKFILEMPELREAVEALEFYGNKDNWQDPDSYVPYWTLWNDGANVGFNEAQNALSKLKALGIVKEGE